MFQETFDARQIVEARLYPQRLGFLGRRQPVNFHPMFEITLLTIGIAIKKINSALIWGPFPLIVSRYQSRGGATVHVRDSEGRFATRTIPVGQGGLLDLEI
jgi:hypothetical protein